MSQMVMDKGILLTVLAEVEGEIRLNGLGNKEKAQLFHELGSIHGLLGDSIEQKAAWQLALQLDPGNTTIKESLQM